VNAAGIEDCLAGSLPFPHLDDWLADAALFAQQGLAARQASSGVAAGYLDSVATLRRSDWVTALLHPAVFAFLANEPNESAWPDLCHEVERDGEAEMHGTVRVLGNPGDAFAELLRRLGPGSRRSDCSSAAFLSADDGLFVSGCRSIAGAAELIRDLCPGYSVELNRVVHAVALCDQGTSFRGSSGVIHRGLVFLSPEPSWTIGVFAEELVHETTHNLLDLISLRVPLLDGEEAFEELYAAPFRPDPRHLYGNFHALVVVSRLICLFLAFEEAGIEPHIDWRSRGSEYANRSQAALQEVACYPRLSPAAQLLLDELVRPALSHARGASRP
jgi:hypothetical protein